MKKALISIAFTVILFCSCTTDCKQSLHDIGVSKALAQYRKERIKKLEYKLSFAIPEEKDSTVSGEVFISFTLDTRQDIILDFRNTDNIKAVSANGNECKYNTYNGHIIIPAHEIKEGANNIFISFMVDDLSLNRNDEFLYTLLVPDRARTLFPCFDQPDLKGIFTLTLRTPEAWRVVSNSPVAVEHTENGHTNTQFHPTEPLSTYLFSFVAGKFKKEIYNDGRRTFAAYHRETDPKRTAQLPIIFKHVAQSLSWLEEYTGIPYPFAKYDFIILPGFQYGGMEHTGATLYNDTQMFLGEHPTPDEELDRAHLIAHETAHMWFGDLVTMEWFNDVWTKEVFANYFASRMTEPMFPHVNHRLNWLKSIVTPALTEDRTQGGTAIRQPLDNMRNAGLIYNNIIYNKAPIMLKKLIEIMGEEAFKEGIHDYLVKYSYGNASWDDLIAILDKKSDADLKQFSDVWVNSNGMPNIEFIIEGETLKVRQTDPYERGHCWRQKFNIFLIGDTTREVEIDINGEETLIVLNNKAKVILPNSDGRGYGYFRYDSQSKEWALKNWHTIEDEVCRQSQLMNLHEAYQHGKIDTKEWLHSLVTGLEREKSPLIASTICNYISTPLTESNENSTERRILELSKAHEITSCRLQLTRMLITAAKDSIVLDELYKIWQEESHPLLDEYDYMDMAYELSIRYPARHKEIIDTQLDRIENPDRKEEFIFVSRTLTPDTLKQEQLFHSLLKAENRRIEPWTLNALVYLCHPLREKQAIKYIRPALDALQDIQRTSDIFFPQSWARVLLGERYSNEALNEVEKFFNDNPDYPVLLKNKILQAAWSLQRRAK